MSKHSKKNHNEIISTCNRDINIKNQITNKRSKYISPERELINNSKYESGKISSSNIYWIGYSFSLK